MAAGDEQVRAQFIADTSDFEKGTEKAQLKLKEFGEEAGGRLGQKLNVAGMKMLSREMLTQVGLGTQMKVLFPIVRIAEEGLTTATMAWGGAIATITMGLTLLIPAMMYLIQHKKKLKDEFDASIKALAQEREGFNLAGESTEKNTAAVIALYNAKLAMTKLTLPAMIQKIKEEQKANEEAQLAVAEGEKQMMRLSHTITQAKNSTDDYRASEDETFKLTASGQGQVQALKIKYAELNVKLEEYNRLLKQTSISLTDVNSKEKNADAQERERIKLQMQMSIIYKKTAMDRKTIIREETLAKMQAVRDEEAADKDRAMKKQYYQNEMTKVLIESNKQMKAAEEDEAKATAKTWGETSMLVGEAIGNAAMGATDAWANAGKKIASNMISTWQAQLQAFAALQIGLFNFAGAALAIGQMGALEAAKAVINKMADGGVVNRPTLALIGEAGPEAVVPLNKAGGMGFGGGSINHHGDVNLNLPGVKNRGDFSSPGNLRTMERQVMQILGNTYQRLGQKGRNS